MPDKNGGKPAASTGGGALALLTGFFCNTNINTRSQGTTWSPGNTMFEKLKLSMGGALLLVFGPYVVMQVSPLPPCALLYWPFLRRAVV